MPLVTIIVPAFNCAVTISETLDALLNQEYKNIEIIVVNDGSDDETIDILCGYGNEIILINQGNTGVAAARNAGIRTAQGNLISFCDADDLWAPQKVAAQVAYLRSKPSLMMVYCDWIVWRSDDEGQFIVPESFNIFDADLSEIELAKSGWIYHKLLLDCICLTSTVMLRKSAIEQIGYFDTDLKCGEDYDYWLRASRITEIHKLKKKLVLYRQHPHSITHKPNNIHYELKVLNKAIAYWGVKSPNGEQNDPQHLKERFIKMKFDFGYCHLKTGDPIIAIKSFLNLITVKPFWFLPWAYFMLSLKKYLFI